MIDLNLYITVSNITKSSFPQNVTVNKQQIFPYISSLKILGHN